MADDIVMQGVVDAASDTEINASQMTISDKLKEARGNIARHSQDERARKSEEERLRKQSEQERGARAIESEKQQKALEKQASRDESEALEVFKQNRSSEKKAARNKQKAILEENLRRAEEERLRKEEREREIQALLEREKEEAEARKRRARELLSKASEKSKEPIVSEINKETEQAPAEEPLAQQASEPEVAVETVPEKASDLEEVTKVAAEPDEIAEEPIFAGRPALTDEERRKEAKARVRDFLGYDPDEEPEDNGVINVGEPEQIAELNVIGPEDEWEDDGIITVTADEENEDDGVITVDGDAAKEAAEPVPQNPQYPGYDPMAMAAYSVALTDYINKQNEYYAAMNSANNVAAPAPKTEKVKPVAKKAAPTPGKIAEAAAAAPAPEKEEPTKSTPEKKEAENPVTVIAPVVAALDIPEEKPAEAPSEVPIAPVAEAVAEEIIGEPILANEEPTPEQLTAEESAEETEASGEETAEPTEGVEESGLEESAEEETVSESSAEPEEASVESIPAISVTETPDETERGRARVPESDEADTTEEQLPIIPPLSIDDDIVAKILEEGRLTENKKQLKKYIKHSDKASKAFEKEIKKKEKLLEKISEDKSAPETLVGIIRTTAKIITIRQDNITTAVRIKNAKISKKASAELSEAIEEYNSRVGAYKLMTGESLTRLSSFLPEHLLGGTGRAVVPRLFYRDNYLELEVDKDGIPVAENDSFATELINPPFGAFEAIGALECGGKGEVSPIVKRASVVMSKLNSAKARIEKTVAKNSAEIDRSLDAEARIIEARDKDARALALKYAGASSKAKKKKHVKKLRKTDKRYGKALRAVLAKRAELGLEKQNARLVAESFAIDRERALLESMLLAEVGAFASDKVKTGIKRELVASLVSFENARKRCQDSFGNRFTEVKTSVADGVAAGNLPVFPKIACRKELCEVVGDELRVVGDRLKAREPDPALEPPKAGENNDFDAEDPFQNGAYVREGLLVEELMIAGETVTDKAGYKRFRKRAAHTLKLLERTVKQSDKAIFRAHGKNDAEFAVAENIRVRARLLEARKLILTIAKKIGAKADREQDALYDGITAYNNRVIDYRSVTGQRFRRISAFLPENVMKDGQETDIPEVSYTEHYFEAFARSTEDAKGYTDPYGKSVGFVPVAYPNRRYTENPTVMTTVINPPYSASEKVELDSVDDRGEYRRARRKEFFILRRLQRAERRIQRRKKRNNKRAHRFEVKLNKLNKKQDKAIFALESLVPESERDKPEYKKRLLSATRKQRRALLKLKYKRSGAAIARTAMQIEAEELVIYRERVALFAKKLYNVRAYGRPAVISTAKETLLKAIREYNRRAKDFSDTAREPIARISTEIIDSIAREGKVYTFPRLLLCREIIENVAGDRRAIGDKYRYGMPYTVNARGVAVKTGTNLIAMGLGSSLVTLGPDLEPVFGSASSDFKYIGAPNPKAGKEARRAPGDLDKLAKEEADKVAEEVHEIEDGLNSYTVSPVSFKVGDIEESAVDALDVKSRAISTPRDLAYLLRHSKKAERALFAIVRDEEKKIRALEDKPISATRSALRKAIAKDSAARAYAKSHRLGEVLPAYFGTDGEIYSLTDALKAALSHHDYATVNEAVYKLSELLRAPEHRLVDMQMLRYEELVAENTPLHGEIRALFDAERARKRPKYESFEKKVNKKLKDYDQFLKANLAAYSIGLWAEDTPELEDERARAQVSLEALFNRASEALGAEDRVSGEETVETVREALDLSAREIIECRVDKLAALGSIVNVRRMNLYGAAKIPIGFKSAVRLAFSGHGFRTKARARLRLSEIIGVYNHDVGSLDKYLGDEKLSLISPLLPEEVAGGSVSSAIPELISCERFTEAFYQNGEVLARLLEKSRTYRSGSDCGFIKEDINRLEYRSADINISGAERYVTKRDYKKLHKRYISARNAIDKQLSDLEDAIDSAVDSLDRIRDKKIRRTERYNRRVLRTTEKIKRTDKCQKRLSRVLLKYRRKMAKLDERALAVSILKKIKKGKSVITDELGVARGYEGIIRCGAAERVNLERRRMILACRFLRELAERATERHRVRFIADAKAELALAMAHYNRCVRATAEQLCERELSELSGSIAVDVMDTSLPMEEVEASIPEVAYLRALAEYLGKEMRPIRKRA